MHPISRFLYQAGTLLVAAAIGGVLFQVLPEDIGFGAAFGTAFTAGVIVQRMEGWR